jgi:hypothetical protein
VSLGLESVRLRWRRFDSHFWVIQRREFNDEVYFCSRAFDQQDKHWRSQYKHVFNYVVLSLNVAA